MRVDAGDCPLPGVSLSGARAHTSPSSRRGGLARETRDESLAETTARSDGRRACLPRRGRAESFSATAQWKASLLDAGERRRAGPRALARAKSDGRLRITTHETAKTGHVAHALGAAAGLSLNKAGGSHAEDQPASPGPAPAMGPEPRLNIVIMVIGSRGDTQPFLHIAEVLRHDYGHHVCIATYPAFCDFVQRDSGLDFSVGGDPSELMSFMVKNPGLIPSLDAVRAGEIGRRRGAMADMFEGFWRACTCPSDRLSHEGRDGDPEPFVADAIIANPPSFAHIHCAEALGVPLHLVFTFPCTPTEAFPHPLASINKSKTDTGYTNLISYPLVETVVWQGLGDLVNNFRVRTLGLDPVSTIWAPGATYRLRVPVTYLWSSSLVPTPEDWGKEISVSGFVFLDLASAFIPPQRLQDFLDAGEPPIYIGFGSIVIDDADSFTDMIFDAISKAGVHAVLSKGWGGFGSDHTPENVFLLDNTPHDWLFPKTTACVIHGGAGTTAIALKCGRPVMVIPFFGDQHFWGNMVASSGAGPEPVPYKHLDADKLADGIRHCLTEDAKKAAAEIAASIERDGDGAQNAVRVIHSCFDLQGPNSMRCSILRDRVAAWRLKDTKMRLSPLAAEVLVGSGLLCWSKLRLLRHTEWNDFEGPGEPITGLAGSLTGTVKGILRGVGGMPYRLGDTAKKRTEAKHTKHLRNKQRSQGTILKGEALAAKVYDSEDSLEATDTGPGPDRYLSDIATSVGQAAWAMTKAPVSLTLALAQGFHNAPRLYGDDTVRRPTRYRSGLTASRRELVHGVHDGVTGAVRFPVRGAKDGGVAGFASGTGMGLGGLVLKSASAIVGPFSFALQGLIKQAERRRRRRPQACVRRARIAQGQYELRELGDSGAPGDSCRGSLEAEVLKGWRVMQQLKREAADQQRRGLTGKLDRLRMDTGLMFEDVDVARDCLARLSAGGRLDEVVGACKQRSA